MKFEISDGTCKTFLPAGKALAISGGCGGQIPGDHKEAPVMMWWLKTLAASKAHCGIFENVRGFGMDSEFTDSISGREFLMNRVRKISPKFSCIKFFQIRDVPTQIPGHSGHSLSKTTEKGHLHKVFVRDIPTSGSRMSQEYPAQKLYV